jgi:DNA-binding transcriptional regulator YiaG
MATAGVTGAVSLVEARQLASSGEARQIRQQAGLSLAEIAEAVGVGRATVYRWETGLRSPHGAPARRYGSLLRALREAPRA